MSDRIEKAIVIAAPIERVWQAISDYREFGEWFRVALDQPFVVGEPSTGHITFPGYEHCRWNADVVAVEAPHLLSFRAHPHAVDPDIDYSAEPKTLVEFRLVAEGEATRLTVVESGFDAIPEHRRAEAYRMNDHGWTLQVENVRAYIEG
jgi:uncharacterized protein YndB with AHSA1/START domain